LRLSGLVRGERGALCWVGQRAHAIGAICPAGTSGRMTRWMTTLRQSDVASRHYSISS